MNVTIWVYYVLNDPIPTQLTALGRQGWELVAVTCIVSGFSRSEKAYFKRPQLAGVPPPLALTSR